MIIKEKMCYSKLIFLLVHTETFSEAVEKVEFSRPLVEFEGMAGYIETEVTFHIRNLKAFSKLWEHVAQQGNTSWYHVVRNGFKLNKDTI